MHLSHVYLTTLKIHSISQTPPNFEQRTSLEVVNNRNEATSLMRIPFVFVISWDASMECLLTGRNWAVQGHMVWKKNGQLWAVWGKVGYGTLREPVESGDSILRGWGTWVSGDSLVVRALDSWSKGPWFESPREQWENYLLHSQLSVLTLLLVSIPPLCYCSSTETIPVILPNVQVAGYS